MLIRQATVEDRPILEQLIPESARALSAGHYTTQQIESAIAYLYGVDTQLILDGTYYVAEIDGQIVGCGGWSKRKTLYGGDQAKAGAVDTLLDPAHDPARIRAFFVHPAWARHGIGRRIIEVCEAAAQASGFTSIELAATLPGEPLYQALGYEVQARFEIPLPDQTMLPVAQMRKQLALGCRFQALAN